MKTTAIVSAIMAVAAIVADIRATVERKRKEGVYADAAVAIAERNNLSNLKDEEDFVSTYIEGLRDAVFVDIGDFGWFCRCIRL